MPKKLFPDELLKYYDQLIVTSKGIERKGATMQYTSLNGHMFSFLDKEFQFGLRLPAGVREEFLKKYNANIFEAHGTVLKEYVRVPGDVFKDTKKLIPYYLKSFEYIKSLKPKVAKGKTSHSK